MKILISAAEASSDAHAAKLLESLREQLAKEGESLDAFGVGGPKLQAAGLRAVVDARDLLSMGFVEILGRLPKIFQSLRKIADEAEKQKPDFAVVVDYPDFHFRLARKLKRLGVRPIYYIPPKVWAWRTGRVRSMRRLFAKVICILPFEESFYESLDMPVKFVGNPLIEELPMGLSREDARSRLGLKAESTVVLVMPGSRPSELREHLELMLESVTEAARRMKREIEVLCPFPSTVKMNELEPKLSRWRTSLNGVRVRFSQDDAAVCMAAADGGLVKSGTSTLEAGLMACPHAVVYRPSRSTEFIFKNLIRYRGPVGLVNLVADERGPEGRVPFLCRELLMDQATVENLSLELIRLLTDEEARTRLKLGFQALRERMLGDSTGLRPSARAAQEILALRDRQDR